MLCCAVWYEQVVARHLGCAFACTFLVAEDLAILAGEAGVLGRIGERVGLAFRVVSAPGPRPDTGPAD